MGACGTADIECFLLACAGRQCDASHLYYAYALVYGALWLFLLFFYSEMVIRSYVCNKEAAFQVGRANHSYDFFWSDQDCLPAYVKSDFRSYIKYWKWGLALFVASYIAFSNMPWPPEDFWYDYHHQSVLQLVVNDGLKMILGVTGSCLALIFLYKLLPYMKETSLYHLAAREGQYTLDIYLIQIIVIEKLLGPFYKQLVSQSGINWVNEYGLIVKVVSTLVLAAILLGIVMGISRLCHKNQYVSKILFWKS